MSHVPRATVRNLAAALVVLGFTLADAAPLAAAERLEMKLTATGATPSLTVSALNGKPDRLTEKALTASLALEAAVGDESMAYKILSSELFLKPEGMSGAARDDDTSAQHTPAARVTRVAPVSFALDAQGPVAQNAFAACATRTSSRASVNMNIPVVWRVTTGRFDFRWMQANLEGSSDRMLDDPAYYSDQATQDLETAISVEVKCDGVTTAVAAAPQRPAAANKTAAASPRAETSGVVQVSNAEPAHSATTAPAVPSAKPAAAAEPASTARAAPRGEREPAKFVCDGGMVRRPGTDAAESVCLCPGNTMRVSRGVNDHACVRRIAGR